MLALRRQWSTMSRGPSNASLCLRDDDDEATEEARVRTRARGGDGTRAGGASGGVPDAKKNAHRASPNTVAPEKRRHTAAKSSTKGNLKARLAEVLIPTRSVPSNEWRFNTRVTGLNLANASIGPEGAAFLAKALHGRENPDGSWAFNVTLRSLNLEFNSIGDEGACAILDALSPKWVPGPGLPGRILNSGRGSAAGRSRSGSQLRRRARGRGGARSALALASARDGRVVVPGRRHARLLFHNHSVPGARASPGAAPARTRGGGVVQPVAALAPRGAEPARDGVGTSRAVAPVGDPRTGDWVHNPTFKHLREHEQPPEPGPLGSRGVRAEAAERAK